MQKINPRVDLAFKKIFGVEENKDLLISLLNSIVSQEDQVAEVTLLNPYNPKNFRSDKLSILDIKAKGVDGKRFNVEIQISDEADYDKRALYYWSKLYADQLQASEDYASLSKAIGIHILNFTSIPEVTAYHNVFDIREQKSGIVYFKDLELHTIELKKFSGSSSKELSEMVEKVKTSLDRWMAFLIKHELLDRTKLPKELDDPNLKKALAVLEVMNFTPEEREAYEDHLKWLRIEANTLRKYENKGRQEGIQQGIQQGIESRNLEIAKSMLKEDCEISLIQKVTGYTFTHIPKS
jgi:predicted transposase/invertase (TIGR01784 family)